VRDNDDITNHIQANSRPIGDGSPDSVTLTSGLAMVRSIRLVANPTTTPDTVITASDEQRDLADASVRFQGPYVVLAADGTRDVEATSVPTGSYTQLRFVLQKARSTDDLSGHTELVGSSIRISGTVWRNGQGTGFTYTTDYTSEIAVNGSYTVPDNLNGYLALTFEAGRWFRYGRGWIDPTESTNRLQIIRNLRSSVTARIVAE
jgi:hypothetical protein